MNVPKGTAGGGTNSSARHWLQAADVPRWMIPDLSDLAVESTPALRCYLALTKRADYATGIVSSTYEQVAEDAKMARGRAAAGISKLVELGWLEQISKGKQHRASTYQLRAESAATRTERAADLHERVSSPEIETAELDPVDNSPSSPEIETPGASSSPGFVHPAVLIPGLTTESFQRTTNRPERASESPAVNGVAVGRTENAPDDNDTPGSLLLASLPQVPDKRFIAELGSTVDGLLASGWSEQELRQRWLAGLDGANNPLGALRYRINDTPRRSSRPSLIPTDRPCGQCDARPGEGIAARMVEDAQGRPSKCPRCHPGYRKVADVIELEAARQERNVDPFFDQAMGRLAEAKSLPG